MLASAAACIALTLCASAAFGQDKNQTPPAQPPAPAEPPSNDITEIQRRLKANAEKLGIKTERPIPGAEQDQPKEVKPSPAAIPNPGVPTPKPGASNTPGANPQPGKPAPSKPVPGAPPKGGPGTPPAKSGPGAPPKSPAPGVPPAGQPSTGVMFPAAGPAPDPSTLGPDEILIDFGTEADLVQFVTHFVRDELKIQLIFMDSGLMGQKFYLSSPIVIKRKNLLPFITMLLEQKMYTLVQDSSGIYMVQPKQDISIQSPSAPTGWGTTRVIHTPNIKPTSLQNSITALVTAGRAGQPGVQPIYMDDLGILIMTDSPRVLNLVEDLVNTVVTERADLKFFRFDLGNISAAAAKDRVLELLGQQSQRTGGAGGSPPPGVAAIGPGGSLTNLGERITVDPTSNALFLRGRDDERKLLTDMLLVIDKPNSMDSRWYAVGNKTALAVATQGKAEQLGAVSEFDFDTPGGRSGGALAGAARAVGGGGAGGSQADSSGSGAGFILYPESGGFIYRGTVAQHARVKDLIESLKIISADEATTYEFYKLRHGKAADVANVIQSLLSNTPGSGNRGGLLGGDLGGRSRTRNPTSAGGSRTSNTPRPSGEPGAASASGIAEIDGASVFVLADEPNNQILVKAPAKLQPQFRELIGKIDLRRPQVYIDAKIIVISSSDSFRLAVEAQQIIGQFAFNTNFGLGSLTSSSGSGSSATTTGDLLSRKNIATGLGGITSALIRSRDVPLIVNALASNIDTRIVASPQLLVDDNEEAMISSVDQQPTGTTTQTSGNPSVTSFGDYQEAGPKLTVTPQISEGGYLRLEYEIELSSFQGSASGNLPPPKLKNNIKSKVMVPTDATVVVGGLTFEQTGNTVVKIPLLGDFPLVGNLFKDQSKSGRLSTLYVFITPKIMRDPSFSDLRLLTRAPLATAHVPAEYPAPEPESIPVIDTAKFLEQRRLREQAEKHKVPPDISPAQGAPVRRERPTSDEPN